MTGQHFAIFDTVIGACGVLWGERGTVGRLYDVMKIWREHATNVTGKSLPAGHFLPEEVPDETLSELTQFLR